jgi:SAM-dependent methyltransferase
MNILNNIYIQKYHEARFDIYGTNLPQSLGWFTKESQYSRFEVLSNVGDLNNVSVLDVGCGNGDLYAFLSQKYTDFQYAGIDIINVFLDNASDQYEDNENAVFYLGNFMTADLPPVDYILLSGSLNYKNTDENFIFKAIARLFQHCHMAFAFNLLSATENPDGILTSYSPLLIKEYCETLSSKVILIDQYELNDFTMMMYK